MIETRRSIGAIALARVGESREATARRLKCSRVQISYWCNGRNKPGPANRALVFRYYQIPPKSWDRYPGEKTPKEEEVPIPPTEPPPAASLPQEVNGTVKARAIRIQTMVDNLLQKLEGDSKATPLEKAKVMGCAAQMLTTLGRLTGEAKEMPETKVLKLPAWRRIEDAMVKALEPWPEAMGVIADAIEDLGG